MPGPVSDAYDPEFGTRENADLVKEAISIVSEKVTERVFGGNRDLRPIIDVAERSLEYPGAGYIAAPFTEEQWRLIRFALNRAAEEI